MTRLAPLPATSLSPSGHETKSDLSSLPITAQATISGVLGRNDPAYHAIATSGGFRSENPAHGLTADFARNGVLVHANGVLVHAGAERFGLTLQRIGHGEALHSVAAAGPTATKNRVEYRRGALTEWYVNGPLGLEQGFTVAEPPAQRTSGPLTLALTLSGTLRASLEPGATDLELALEGQPAALRYRGLAAWDATGQALPAWLELEGRTLLVRVDDAGARYPVTIDPFLEQAKLTASDGDLGDRLGVSVAVSGDTVVVGAFDDDVGANADQGSAYVFVKPGAGWANATEAAKLTASDGAAGDGLGVSVAVSGDTVFVGAYRDDVGANADQGSAYVFVKPGTGWASATETAKLTASDGAASDFLGQSVAVSGDTVVAGAWSDDFGANANQGSAYVFVKPGAGWANATETAKLTASDGAAGDWLGRSVAVSGDTVFVGAYLDDVGANADQGSAYVFVEQPDDATAPTTTIALAPPTPDGQNGWYVSDVHLTVTAADNAGGSGIAETRCVLDPASAPATFDDIPAGCAYTGAGAGVTADGEHTVYAASADDAGNKETPVSASFMIDQTDPTVTCDVSSPGPTFLLLGSGGSVFATVTDVTSGPAAGSESAGANVATVGNKTVSLIGEDEAGNSTIVSCPYRVSYRFLGFQNLKSSYKQNQTIPVKFMLADAAGTAIPDADAQALLTPCRVKVTLDAVEQVGCASYNASTNTFQYNLKTSKSLAVGPHALAIKVSAPDGSGVVNIDGTTITITN